MINIISEELSAQSNIIVIAISVKDERSAESVLVALNVAICAIQLPEALVKVVL
jgi:hypothetical protein